MGVGVSHMKMTDTGVFWDVWSPVSWTKHRYFLAAKVSFRMAHEEI